MPRKKEPLKLLEAKGKSHLSKAEKTERAQSEISAPVPKQVRAPEWLPEDLRKEFNSVARQLIELGIFAKLDRDTLARYLIAHQIYMKATSQVQYAISAGQASKAANWSAVQNRYFTQCRECANDLGLTITSRCRLVVPQGNAPEENAFERMMKQRMERA